MASSSPTTRRVAEALKPLHVLLDSEGFTFEPRQPATKANRRPAVATFRRETPASLQSLQVFGDKWNTKERGEFTIYVGVYLPTVQPLLGREVDADVTPQQATYSVALPVLCPPEEDHWWKINERTDLAALGIEWAALYNNVGRRWFEKVSRPEGLQEELRALIDERWGYAPLAARNEPLLWPAIEVLCGDREMARKALQMMRSDIRFEHVDAEGFRLRHAL